MPVKAPSRQLSKIYNSTNVRSCPLDLKGRDWAGYPSVHKVTTQDLIPGDLRLLLDILAMASTATTPLSACMATGTAAPTALFRETFARLAIATTLLLELQLLPDNLAMAYQAPIPQTRNVEALAIAIIALAILALELIDMVARNLAIELAILAL